MPHTFDNQNLLFDKPKGWTSFDVVKKVRNLLRTKVGHAGTLDPLATGLLIIATGKATKQIDFIQAQPKEYTGHFVLGATTPSFDLETEVDEKFDISHIKESDIFEAAAAMEGESEQEPPVYSAVKINGKPSYLAARKGKARPIEPRKIIIYKFAIEKIEMPDVYFRVACSKGTYIRAMARDFGRKLGAGAYMGSLCRTKIGEYRLEDAWQIDDFADMIRQKINSQGHEGI